MSPITKKQYRPYIALHFFVVFLVVPSTWQIPAGKEGSVIETAVRAGYRRFDCSRYHGNQAEIGAVFKKLFAEGVVRREDLFITDKYPLKYAS